MNLHLNKKTEFIDLGLIDYQEAWDYQERLFKDTVEVKIQNRKVGEAEQELTRNFLIFCEHPHVYTLGKSGDEANLLLDEKGLKEHNATYYKINRGGDITYHGPGQIVGYPILDLENFFTDIHKYMRVLEEGIIRMLDEYGIQAGRIEGLTGVWMDYENPGSGKDWNPRKICALGVKSSRWVTMHGFALNVNSSLDYFNFIIPCGIDDKEVTSMQSELGVELDMEEVKDKLKVHLEALFQMELHEVNR